MEGTYSGTRMEFWHEVCDEAGASSTWACRMVSTRQSASDLEPSRAIEACLQVGVLKLSSGVVAGVRHRQQQPQPETAPACPALSK